MSGLCVYFTLQHSFFISCRAWVSCPQNSSEGNCLSRCWKWYICCQWSHCVQGCIVSPAHSGFIKQDWISSCCLHGFWVTPVLFNVGRSEVSHKSSWSLCLCISGVLKSIIKIIRWLKWIKLEHFLSHFEVWESSNVPKFQRHLYYNHSWDKCPTFRYVNLIKVCKENKDQKKY